MKCDNIPNIIHIFRCENIRYKVIEEFIEGKTLDDSMRNNTYFSENKAIFYICQLCDIKPSNIIITKQNKLYLVDFDISRTYISISSYLCYIIVSKYIY